MTRRIGLVIAGLVATATISSGMAQTAVDTSDGITWLPDVGTTATVVAGTSRGLPAGRAGALTDRGEIWKVN